MADITRVALQERRGFLRDGLAAVVDRQPAFTVVGAVAGVASLVEVADRARPDVAVLEVGGTAWDPCHVAARLRRRHRALRVVGVHRGTVAHDQNRARAHGIHLVAAEAGLPGLLAALHRVSGSADVSNLAAAGAVRADRPPDPLVVMPSPDALASVTVREHDVLGGLANGWTTAEIARRLGISPKTVENHKQRLFTKLGVQNQAHAVSVAIRAGLLGAVTNRRASGA